MMLLRVLFRREEAVATQEKTMVMLRERGFNRDCSCSSVGKWDEVCVGVVCT